MRVLRLKGRNLASLESFAIDLELPPLGHHGLFAITGDTGAGKSTILDALCLALYNRTPRTEGRGGPIISGQDRDQKVRGTDTRLLLRRGAGEAFAEVEFLGHDQSRYRARWEVRRARKKPEGRLREVRHTLVRIDAKGDEIEVLNTHRRKDTEPLVAEAVGLTYQQFTRSVLLPQGGFDAFLKAQSKDRATLLERITGTEIYGDLSKAAAQRKSEAQKACDDAQLALDLLEVLDGPARTALEAELGTIGNALALAKSKVDALRGQQRWYDDEGTRVAAMEEAKAKLAVDQQAFVEAGDRRKSVHQAQLAEAHRAVYEAALGAQRTLAQSRDAYDQRLDEAKASTQVLETTTESLEAATAELAAAKEKNTAMEPELVQATRLDQESSTLMSAADDTGLALAESVVAHESLGTEHEQTKAERKRLDDAQGTNRAWLGARTHVGTVAEDWAGWSGQLQAYGAAAARCEDADSRAKEAKTRADEAESAVARERAALSELTTTIEKDDLTGTEDRLRVAETRLETCTTRLETIQSILATTDRALSANDQMNAFSEAGRQAKNASAAATERRQAADDAIAQKALEIEALEQVYRLAKSGADLEAHRTHLVDGEPCPLCGSREHPGHDPAQYPALAFQRGEIQQRQAERDRLVADRAEANSAVNHGAQRAREAEAGLSKATQSFDTEVKAWSAALPLAGLELPDAPSAEAQSTLRDALQNAETDRAHGQSTLVNARAARDRAITLRGKVESARERLGTAETLHAEAGAHAEAAEARGRENHERIAETRTALAAALTHWPNWETLKATDLVDEIARQVETYLARAETVAEVDARLTAMDGTLRTMEGQLRERADQRVACQSRDETAKRAAKKVMDDRAQLLGGRPTDEVRRALAKALDGAEEKDARTRAAFARAEATEKAAGDASQRALTAVRTAEGEVAQAEALLAARLDEAGLELDALEAAFARPRDWLPKQVADLKRLEDAVKEWEAILRDREGHLAAHRGTPAPEEPLATLAEVTARELAALETLDRARTAVLVRLEGDDAAHAKREAEQPRLTALMAELDAWSRMNDVIGHREGHRFRNFAQNITLEAVVQYANRHLAELAPRYRLARIPHETLELELTDRHLANETRGVSSLSGGESFLVSLAMALGLAHLSARDVRLESLFIDEGFGHLDAANLQQVLSTLDGLHSTGRQVGLISHVPGLAETIGLRIHVSAVRDGLSRVEIITPTP